MGTEFYIRSFCVQMREERTETDVVVRIAPIIVRVEVERTSLASVPIVATDVELRTDQTNTTRRPPLPVHPCM